MNSARHHFENRACWSTSCVWARTRGLDCQRPTTPHAQMRAGRGVTRCTAALGDTVSFTPHQVRTLSRLRAPPNAQMHANTKWASSRRLSCGPGPCGSVASRICGRRARGARRGQGSEAQAQGLEPCAPTGTTPGRSDRAVGAARTPRRRSQPHLAERLDLARDGQRHDGLQESATILDHFMQVLAAAAVLGLGDRGWGGGAGGGRRTQLCHAACGLLAAQAHPG